MTFQSKNYYEALGLPQKLQLDQKLVQKKFYEMSRKVHPDFHQTSINKDLSQEFSSVINQAFQTLKNKDKRLMYMIEQYLGPLDTQADRKNAPKDLLMELMDMQEVLMEFKADASEANRKKITQLVEELDQKIQEFDVDIDQLIPKFDETDEDDTKKQLITQLRDLTLTKNYVKSLKRTFLEALEPSEL